MRDLEGPEQSTDSPVQEGSSSNPLDQECAESALSEQAWYESDLQLAAELGKTLLERNKDLEASLKLQQSVIEDQALEIEYLCKQSAALREVNESRLKVYEQLEISIQDLEKGNQKLQSEANVDKKKIKSLVNTVETLEKKCEELQDAVDELRATNRQHQMQKRRERRRTLGLGAEFEAAELRRVLSVENGFGAGGGQVAATIRWDTDKEAEFVRLQNGVRELRTQKGREQRMREELELEVACAMQENLQLREQLTVLQQREVVMKALQMELQEMEEEFSSQKYCRHCHRDLGSEVTTALETEHEVDEHTCDQSPEHCAVVKLQNGGQAYGNQETIVSVVGSDDVVVVVAADENGHDAPDHGDNSTANAAVDQRRVKDSLLSELDTQYRLLIEKYESMVNARRLAETATERTNQRAASKASPLHRRQSDDESASSDKEEEEYDEPYASMGDSSIWNTADNNNHHHHHIGEEASSMSSGFSDGEIGVAHKSVQTDFSRPCSGPSATTTATSGHGKPEQLTICETNFAPYRSSTTSHHHNRNPVESHFSRTPEYKKIFQEIFAVLKKSVQKGSNTPGGVGGATSSAATTYTNSGPIEQFEMMESFPALSRVQRGIDEAGDSRRFARQSSPGSRSYADVLATTAFVAK